MKKVVLIFSLILFSASGVMGYASSQETGYPPSVSSPMAGGPQEYSADTGYEYEADLGIDYMYYYLAPYGNWIHLAPYGYVWTPRHMGYRWRPYCDGYWVWTDFGWTWIANEEWGSIPFHYGRWGYNDYFGWFWVPGTIWGPAWVSWRWSNQYVGWAPLPPEIEFRPGMDFASLSFNIPIRFWIFLQAPYFLNRDIYHYILPYERNITIINLTIMHNNIFFRNNRIINEGIGIDVVRRVTRREVPHHKIQEVRHPGPAMGQGKNVQVFRPVFRKDDAVKPRVFLDKDQAQKELAPVTVFEPRQQSPLSVQESAVRRRQAEEKSLLEQTQSQELNAMQRKNATELTQTRDTAEKAKFRQDQMTRMAELQKQHQAEKKQLTERHRQDIQQVKWFTQKAKQEKQAPSEKK